MWNRNKKLLKKLNDLETRIACLEDDRIWFPTDTEHWDKSRYGRITIGKYKPTTMSNAIYSIINYLGLRLHEEPAKTEIRGKFDKPEEATHD